MKLTDQTVMGSCYKHGKAKNMHQRHNSLGGSAPPPPLLGNFGTKFSEMSFSHFKTYFTQIAVVTFTQQFRMIDSNNFTLSSMFSFQNAWPIKRKPEYTLLLFHIFSHFLGACENWTGPQLANFLKVLSLILVNLQAMSGGKKCHFRW